jgi:hypothetical protein
MSSLSYLVYIFIMIDKYRYSSKGFLSNYYIRYSRKGTRGLFLTSKHGTSVRNLPIAQVFFFFCSSPYINEGNLIRASSFLFCDFWKEYLSQIIYLILQVFFNNNSCRFHTSNLSSSNTTVFINI